MRFTGVKDPVLEEKVRAIHAEAVAVAAKPGKINCSRKAIRAGRPPKEGLEFLDHLVVEFSNKLSTAAGHAQLNYMTGSITIKLHYRLLRENDKELRSTYLHELAHILAGAWYGYNCGHDDNWRQVAVMIGDDGGRCHTMDVSAYRRAVQRYLYKCPCREFQLTKARHIRAQRAVAELRQVPYYCPSCKKTLQYAEGPVAVSR